MYGNGPLAGIRVADFGQFVAGPAVGQHLADLGATVVKVEPLEGESSRNGGLYGEAMVRTNNRDKLGLAVDLRRREGVEVAERLVEKSDVVIQNMRPATMERLGLGPERVRSLNPRVVYLSITAFGKDAPPTRPGFDIAAQAESGIMSVTGEAGGEPQRVGFTVVDTATSYVAANAVLAALFRRERTDEGAVIDTSLLAVAVHLQGPNWVGWFTSGVEPTRKGNGQPTAAPAAELVSVRDGYIVLSAYTPEHWRRLCTAIDRPDMIDDDRFASNDARLAHRAEMRSELSGALASLTQREAIEMLSSSGIVAGAVRSYSQVLESDDVQRLALFPTAEMNGMGTYRYAAPPFSISGMAQRTSKAAPAVGQDTRAVLGGLGYDPDSIERLLASGVVGEVNVNQPREQALRR